MARHGISKYTSPLILAIENSTMCGSVAIVSPNLCLGEFSVTSSTTHSRRLINSIDTLLKQIDLELSKLDAVAVSLGPGSFTGIRIGLTTAKGLSLASSKKLIGIHSLDALAAQVSSSDSIICAMLDARKSEVFAAFYKNNSASQFIKRQSDYYSAPIAEICKNITDPVLFVGDGALLYQDEIKDNLGQLATFARHEICFPRASAIGMLALHNWESKRFLDPASAAPQYVRSSDAEINFPVLK